MISRFWYPLFFLFLAMSSTSHFQALYAQQELLTIEGDSLKMPSNWLEKDFSELDQSVQNLLQGIIFDLSGVSINHLLIIRTQFSGKGNLSAIYKNRKSCDSNCQQLEKYFLDNGIPPGQIQSRAKISKAKNSKFQAINQFIIITMD